MNETITLVAAITALTATLLSPLGILFAHLLTVKRERVVIAAESRIQWVRSLREELAKLLAVMSQVKGEITNETMKELRLQQAKVGMLLDLKDAQHAKLFKKVSHSLDDAFVFKETSEESPFNQNNQIEIIAEANSVIQNEIGAI